MLTSCKNNFPMHIHCWGFRPIRACCLQWWGNKYCMVANVAYHIAWAGGNVLTPCKIIGHKHSRGSYYASKTEISFL